MDSRQYAESIAKKQKYSKKIIIINNKTKMMLY
jgi:hypothetical protein